ncbi:hypothetical protein ACFE04_005053 [Oxalis oulophora]
METVIGLFAKPIKSSTCCFEFLKSASNLLRVLPESLLNVSGSALITAPGVHIINLSTVRHVLRAPDFQFHGLALARLTSISNYIKQFLRPQENSVVDQLAPLLADVILLKSRCLMSVDAQKSLCDSCMDVFFFAHFGYADKHFFHSFHVLNHQIETLSSLIMFLVSKEGGVMVRPWSLHFISATVYLAFTLCLDQTSKIAKDPQRSSNTVQFGLYRVLSNELKNLQRFGNFDYGDSRKATMMNRKLIFPTLY